MAHRPPRRLWTALKARRSLIRRLVEGRDRLWNDRPPLPSALNREGATLGVKDFSEAFEAASGTITFLLSRPTPVVVRDVEDDQGVSIPFSLFGY
jgi:hypothetical protein